MPAYDRGWRVEPNGDGAYIVKNPSTIYWPLLPFGLAGLPSYDRWD